MKKNLFLILLFNLIYFMYPIEQDLKIVTEYIQKETVMEYIQFEGQKKISDNLSVFVFSTAFEPYYQRFGDKVLSNRIYVLDDGRIINDFYVCSILEDDYTNTKLKQVINQIQLFNSTALLADFDYNENKELMYLTKNSIDSYFCISEIEDGINLFVSTGIPNGKFDNSLFAFKELFNNSLKFCVINQKRGFIVTTIVEKIDIVNDAFYYWSPSEQRYILDESVTQEQLKNAHCPDDYFAYNGLKFSKLDSKLTAEDLQDLDKAQLRLMRNAVYARHGRTFKSVDLQSLWNCYTWYKVNPNYSDELLTDIDKYNIKLIQQHEAQR